MSKRVLVLTCLLIQVLLSWGQHPCGTEVTSEMVQRLLTNRDQPSVQDRMPELVPIKFHLVAESDQTGRIREREILEQLCVVNDHYADQDIQFYIKDGFNYINSSNLYDNPGGSTFLMNLERDNRAINVYCVNNAGGGEGTVTLGYYDPNEDWVVMANQATVRAETEFSHELGHFFSLLHPHNGWDCEQYDASMHGNPVTLTDAPCHSFEVELQNGTNCNDSGDFLCDTPPDYLFGLGWPLCAFTEEVRDPNGDIVDPDELNFMSYFLNCNPDDGYFSNQQKAIIASDLASSSRGYLHIDSPPEGLADITDPINLVSPLDGADISTSTSVTLSWEPVANATSYLVEISRLPNFSLGLQSVITSSTEVEFDGLEPNRRYHWRVIPFNPAFTCFSNVPVQDFTTALMTNVRETESETLRIYPSPVDGNYLRLDTDMNLESVRLITTEGREILYTQEVDNNISLPSSVANGMYILVAKGKNSRAVRKVSIFR